MDLVGIFNGIEAAWWFAVATLIVFHPTIRMKLSRGHRLWAALWLFAFGLSDVIEIFTGAWWRPLGLLLLKACCVSALAGQAIYFLWGKVKRTNHRDEEH